MGKRTGSRDFGRRLTKGRQGSTSNAGSAVVCEYQLTASELLARGRARRREQAFAATGDGDSVPVRASPLLGLEWRIQELRHEFQSQGLPAPQFDSGVAWQISSMIRDPGTLRWSIHQSAARFDANPSVTEPGDHVPTLRTLAVTALAKMGAQLDSEELHELALVLPHQLKRQFVTSLVQNTPSDRRVPDEAVSLLRAFPFETLDMSFRRFSIFSLLTPRGPSFHCSRGCRGDVDKQDRVVSSGVGGEGLGGCGDEPADSWEDDPAVAVEPADNPLRCPLHCFHLHHLDTLDLSFATLAGVKGPDMVALISEALPQLRALFLAGCLQGTVHGPDTVSAIVKLLPSLTTLDLAHNMFLAPVDLEIMSLAGALPLLHTLFIHDCVLIKPSVATLWWRSSKPTLLNLHI
eukprot:m.460078 g.460078  ORF g.460078 m.460078 type:complete len:406 (+) comp21923_c0_seq1:297-1514(+)